MGPDWSCVHMHNSEISVFVFSQDSGRNSITPERYS